MNTTDKITAALAIAALAALAALAHREGITGTNYDAGHPQHLRPVTAWPWEKQ